MKILISHPTGNAFVRAATVGLMEKGILGEFRTTVAVFPGDKTEMISKLPFFKQLRRRTYDPGIESLTKTWPWRELGRLLSSNMGLKRLTVNETGIFSVDAVYKDLDLRVSNSLKSNNHVDAIYAYEDGALNTFKAAKKMGMACYYDLPIGYWRTAKKLLEHEKERWPEWIPTLTGFHDSAEKLANKDQELLLADKIFVASTFTKNSLKDFPGALAPVDVIPYGFPPVFDKREYSPIKNNQRLKLLFVGGLSQRKGIADLLAVADKLKDHVELTIIGLKIGTDCRALNVALTRHNWFPSLPHDQVLKKMREHDVLVFPSLFEGFGLVITEAMSQGTPVITTERTAGPDLINHGENGWLISAGSTDALQSAIEDILGKTATIAAVGRAAMETASKRPWKVYGDELAHSVKNALNNNC